MKLPEALQTRPVNFHIVGISFKLTSEEGQEGQITASDTVCISRKAALKDSPITRPRPRSTSTPRGPEQLRQGELP